MKHASFFSGIGGFDLTAEWAGFKNIFTCEINPILCKILAFYFKNTLHYEDIKKTDFSTWEGKIDILTGVFPCQPFSVAGERKGTEDNRYLWPEFLRGIREIKPRWVVAENVLGIISIGNGLVFEQVCLDLETEGYQVQPYVLPACSVDAPHQRYRVWIVAYRADAGTKKVRKSKIGIFTDGNASNAIGIKRISRRRNSDRENKTKKIRTCLFFKFKRFSKKQFTSYTAGKRHKKRTEYESIKYMQNNGFTAFPTQPPICCGNDGIPSGLDGITFPKWRNESIKAFGNAIVPQVALQIFEAIKKYESIN